MENAPLQNSPNPEVVITKPQLRDKLLKISPILVTLIAVLVLTINFSRVSNLIPQFTKSRPKPSPSSNQVAEKISIPCPSVKSFCTDTEPIIENGKVFGFGAKLPKNTPIYASFDGGVITRSRYIAKAGYKETINQIMLISKDKKLTAVYYIKDSPTLKGHYQKGDLITKTSDKTIKSYNDSSLIFTLLGKGNQAIPQENIVFE